MNDRYLFRGKRFNNDEWVQGTYTQNVKCTPLGAIIVIDVIQYIGRADGATYSFKYEIDPATIGQCTGLRDKNGTLIFEGDVLQWAIDDDPDSKDIFVVEWLQHTWQMILLPKSANYKSAGYGCKRGLWSFPTPDGKLQCLIVIGNIHDNPELLT